MIRKTKRHMTYWGFYRWAFLEAVRADRRREEDKSIESKYKTIFPSPLSLIH